MDSRACEAAAACKERSVTSRRRASCCTIITAPITPMRRYLGELKDIYKSRKSHTYCHSCPEDAHNLEVIIKQEGSSVVPGNHGCVPEPDSLGLRVRELLANERV